MRMIRRLAMAAVLAACASATSGGVAWTTSFPAPPAGHVVSVSSPLAIDKDMLVANAEYKNIQTGQTGYTVTCASLLSGSHAYVMYCAAPMEVSTASPDSYRYTPVESQVPDPTNGAVFYSYSGSTAVAEAGEAMSPGVVTPPPTQYKSTLASWWMTPNGDLSHGHAELSHQQLVSLDSSDVMPNTVAYRAIVTSGGQPQTVVALRTAMPNTTAVTLGSTEPIYAQNISMWTKGSARIRAYAGSIFRVENEGKSISFLQADPNNSTLPTTRSADLVELCGFSNEQTLVEWDIIPYAFFQPKQEILNAFIFWGRSAQGATVISRVSHNSFTKTWVVTLSNLASITAVSGGSGYFVVSGPARNVHQTAYVIVLDNEGNVVFTKTRKLSDDVSAPTVHNQAVIYATSSGIVGAELATGNEYFYKPFSCRLKPLVTDDRIFCVSGSTLLAFDQTNDAMLWSVENVTAVFPPILDPTKFGTHVIVMRSDGTISAIGDFFRRFPTTPTTGAPAPPEKKSHAAGIALGIIMSLLIVAGVAAGAVYYFKRVRPQTRAAIPEEEIGSTPAPTPKGGLYGAVNE